MGRKSLDEYTESLKDIYLEYADHMEEAVVEGGIHKAARDFKQKHGRNPDFQRPGDIFQYHELLANYIPARPPGSLEAEPLLSETGDYPPGEFHDYSDITEEDAAPDMILPHSFYFRFEMPDVERTDEIDVRIEDDRFELWKDGTMEYGMDTPTAAPGLAIDSEELKEQFIPDTEDELVNALEAYDIPDDEIEDSDLEELKRRWYIERGLSNSRVTPRVAMRDNAVTTVNNGIVEVETPLEIH
jgi:hypothetical protein